MWKIPITSGSRDFFLCWRVRINDTPLICLLVHALICLLVHTLDGTA
jgi:hypothetical protein